MKPAGNDTRIIRDSEGNPYGVLLAGNHAAEHECGIRRILHYLNIDPDGKRLEGRSMTAPAKLHTAKGQVTQKYYLDLEKPKKQTDKLLYVSMDPYELERDNVQYNLARYKLDTEFTAAWDDRCFKFAAWTKDAANFLKEIVEAAANSNLTVFIGQTQSEKNNPFCKSGLIFAITSKMPQAAIDAINQDDEEEKKLNAAVEATGIVKLIEENTDKLKTWSNGRAYHALSPAWAERFGEVGDRKGKITDRTKHPVVFFLNPADNKYNFGWFTVEELEEWIQGKGPVIKTKEQAA